ncbi:MAG TPA: GAF domain-containing protein, partial [Anaerolineae bacterium]|nr:GAF domain-containing protein [Anaerolineae bacterium]
VFPDGKLFPPRWYSWVLLFAVAKVIGTTLDILSYQPGTPRFGPTLAFNPFFVPALEPYQYAISTTLGATSIFILIGVIMGIASLVLRFRVSSTQAQQRIKWLLWWAVVFVLVMPLYYLVSLGISIGNAQISNLIPLLMYLNLGGLLIAAIGIAILRYHLFDIDLILNRTLVYGGLTAGVVFGYVFIVGVLSAKFQASNNLIISLLATGIIAILFQPVREGLQRAVNRLIYGERDDPYTVLSQLGQRLETTLAPDAVLPTIVETVAQALKLPYAEITLTTSDQPQTAIVYPPTAVRRPPSIVSFHLTYQHEKLGELVVAQRVGEEKFSAADLRLLNDLSRQAGIAAHAAQLTADLQKSREHLV